MSSCMTDFYFKLYGFEPECPGVIFALQGKLTAMGLLIPQWIMYIILHIVRLIALLIFSIFWIIFLIYDFLFDIIFAIINWFYNYIYLPIYELI